MILKLSKLSIDSYLSNSIQVWITFLTSQGNNYHLLWTVYRAIKKQEYDKWDKDSAVDGNDLSIVVWSSKLV